MRVENNVNPATQIQSDRVERAARVDRSAATSRTDEFTSSTSDLVSLLIGLGVENSAASQQREAAINRLKAAYEAGAIRPDANRIASAIMRFESRPAGDAK